MSHEITQELLQLLFDYRDGKLFWSDRHKLAGREAGYECVLSDGRKYRKIRVGDKQYLTHRLVFMFFNGYMPAKVDHSDRDTLRNDITNLRPATNSQNGYNSKIHARNTSGEKGVGWHTASGKWRARVRVEGRTRELGLYEDLELAALVATEARNLYHGAFARHV